MDDDLKTDSAESARSPHGYAADRLAYACAKAIMRGDLRTRSAIDDALLDYLEVGGPDGPNDVPTWVANYERVLFSGSNDDRKREINQSLLHR